MFKETLDTPTQPTNDEPETLIGPSVKVEGDFITEGNIVIEGTVSGTVKTSKDIKIGTNSKIFADMSAENVLISGEVQGNIEVSNKLELTPTAKVFGDVSTKTLIIAAGSILNGKCKMVEEKDKAPKPSFSKQNKIELSTEEKEGEAKKAKKK
jgi:cytoskeletal protein CcmA (bactofilin family)